MTTRTRKIGKAVLLAFAAGAVNCYFFRNTKAIFNSFNVLVGLVAFLYMLRVYRDETGGISLPASERSAAWRKARTAFIVIWVWVAVFALAAPLWLPIIGVSLGMRWNFFVGVLTAAIMSAVFAARLKNMREHPTSSPVPPSAQPPHQP